MSCLPGLPTTLPARMLPHAVTAMREVPSQRRRLGTPCAFAISIGAMAVLASCSVSDRAVLHDAAPDAPNYPTDLVFSPLEYHLRSRTAFTEVVRSREQWEAFVQSHPPQDFYQEPKVDFARHDLIAVGLGERPTTRFSVRVLGVGWQQDRLQVTYLETRPGNCSGGLLVTSPSAFATIAKQESPVTFTFVHRVFTETCDKYGR